jgi:hypothetical protein
MVEEEVRKTSDIIVDLDQKIDQLLALVRTQDLLIKVLSNKMSELSNKIDKMSAPAIPPNIKIGAVDVKQPQQQQQQFIPPQMQPKATQSQAPIYQNPKLSDADRQFLISPENNIPTAAPGGKVDIGGARRTNRQETESIVIKPSQVVNQIRKPQAQTQAQASVQQPSPQQPPNQQLIQASERYPIQIPNIAGKQNINIPKDNDVFTDVSSPTVSSIVPVIQRVVSSNGKNIHIASVEIINADTLESIKSTRTNAAGRWSISLPIGRYRTLISKTDIMTKERMEVINDFVIDGRQSPLELENAVLK